MHVETLWTKTVKLFKQRGTWRWEREWVCMKVSQRGRGHISYERGEISSGLGEIGFEGFLRAYRKYSFCLNNSIRQMKRWREMRGCSHFDESRSFRQESWGGKGFVRILEMVSVTRGLGSGGYAEPRACWCRCNAAWSPVEVRIYLRRLQENSCYFPVPVFISTPVCELADQYWASL